MKYRICGCCEKRPVQIFPNGLSRSACSECFKVFRQVGVYWASIGTPIMSVRRPRARLQSILRGAA